MSNYVYIEDGVIKEYRDILPKSWKNISGLNLIDENHLKDLGWYKVTKIQSDHDPDIEYIDGHDYEFKDGEVYQTPIIKSKPPVENPTMVPEQISAMQIRLWLIKNNINLAQVQGAIDSIEDVLLRDELSVKWEYAPYFERSNPFIDQVGSILGLSSEQIDQAFIEASEYT
jgi:hypothetical protein